MISQRIDITTGVGVRGGVFYMTVIYIISIFYDISLVRFVCDAEYANACKRKVKMTVKGNSIVDSV